MSATAEALTNSQARLWPKFGAIWPQIAKVQVERMFGQGVGASEWRIRSWHHRGSGCAQGVTSPPFVKRVFWQICGGGRSDILICQTITCEIKHSNLESESCEQRYAPVGRWIISPARSSCQPPTHRYCSLRQELFLVGKSNNCETQTQASIGWVALSSVVRCLSFVPHR